MATGDFSDLVALIAVARERSFTRAAAQLGISQSALSHTIRSLETRLGVQLLARTTRSVSPTEAGAKLLKAVAPLLDEIHREVAALSDGRNQPSGLIRITTAEHAANTVLWPRLQTLLQDYPGIRVEIDVNYGMTDIVAQRFHAGVRLGDQVEKDMVAVRIGPDLRIAVVGSPDYFSRHPPPQSPQDLSRHQCINLRLPTHDSHMIWEFEKEGASLKAHVEGQWAFNMGSHILRAAIAGWGLAYLPADMAKEEIACGKLISVLDDWCQPYPGYHLYYPKSRQAPPAFSLLVDCLRYRV
mgnify:CR=1 FL=1|jgi:DNA-binding transcriptional LysR family regulator